MANIFLISDTHFGHFNSLKWAHDDGTPMREFESVEEMDETMVRNWNSVVSSKDKVYHLGDVSMSHKELPILDRLNGEKVLIKGNHDVGKLSQYMKYFKDVRASHQLSGMLLTHIPVHPESLARWGINLHGHLHTNVVKDFMGNPDTRYFNVSVERINFTPISLETIKSKLDPKP